MFSHRRRLALALAAAAATASVTAVPAQANLLDPVVEILPARPVPYHPSTETTCADADPQCLTDTIAHLQQHADTLIARCDHDAVFALAYLRVTQEVSRAIDEGIYDDEAWLRHQDAVFAEDYFETYEAWHDGRKDEVPQAWRIALQAADDGSVSALGDFMLAMNAHINRDFSYVLAGVGLTGPDGKTHKPDHNRFNARLDALYQPVFAEMAERLDPRFDDLDLGPLDDEGVGTIMRAWREIVWRNAEALALAKTPLQRRLAEQRIESYAASQATLYRVLFAANPKQRQERDAFCASHPSA